MQFLKSRAVFEYLQLIVKANDVQNKYLIVSSFDITKS